MKLIENITDISFLQFNLFLEAVDSLEVEDAPFAMGGYGQLYKLDEEMKANGIEDWVVKIADAATKVNQVGYRNMRELFSKVKDFHKANYSSLNEFLIDYPPMIGFPVGLFEAEFDGRKIYCYLMPNLNNLGYILLDEALQGDGIENYYGGVFENDELQRRFRGGYQLAKTFDLLWDKFNYLHGDIKAKSVWIHESKALTALIDFDGGHFRQNEIQKIASQFRQFVNIVPPIMGENQEWLAPEIKKEIESDSDQAKLFVTEASDYWSFNMGMFQLFTGLFPYFLLTEHGYGACSDYLKKYSWPFYDLRDKRFQNAATRQIFKPLVAHLEKHPEVFSLWVKTLNNGFSNKSKRVDFRNWKEVLFGSILEKMPLLKIITSKSYVLEGGEIQFSWESDGGYLLLDGQPVSTHGSLVMNVSQVPQFSATNEFGSWTFDFPIELVQNVKVISCGFSDSKIKLGSPVKIKWKAEHAASVFFFRKGVELEVKSEEVEFVPDAGETVEMVFKSKYNIHAERIVLSPQVISPVTVNYFNSDRIFIAETLPINLSWSVQHAELIEIVGLKQLKGSDGSIQLRPLTSTEYILKATNDFFEDSKLIYVEVMSIPKLNLQIPDLPKLNILIPDLFTQVPHLISDTLSIKNRLKEIFKN